MSIETGTPIEKLLNPEYQRQWAMTGLRLVAKFFGPDVAQKEAKGSGLSPEDIKDAINTGVEEAKKRPAET